jgi:phage baseplate assembly protein W
MPGNTLPGPLDTTRFYDVVNAMWPGLREQQAFVAPARNGMDRFTGKLLSGWPHVEQCLEYIFATPFHVRPLRQWVGTYVPHLLGENDVARIITRHYWAIASGCDMWEPNYRIRTVYFMGPALQSWSNTVSDTSSGNPVKPTKQMLESINDVSLELRKGHAFFRIEGAYRPRAHLGDYTTLEVTHMQLLDRSGQFIE